MYHGVNLLLKGKMAGNYHSCGAETTKKANQASPVSGSHLSPLLTRWSKDESAVIGDGNKVVIRRKRPIPSFLVGNGACGVGEAGNDQKDKSEVKKLFHLHRRLSLAAGFLI
jgi:hypothetical protein